MDDSSRLEFLVGTTDDNETIYGDFQKTGNFISAGHTGSGHASYDEAAFVTNLLQNYSPDELKFVMIDPKMVQLTPYENIPHLLMPIAYTPDDAATEIREAIKHVKVRRQLFESLGAKTLTEYNTKHTESDNPLHGKLPYIVFLCTEVADLMMIDGKFYEKAFVEIARDASKVGIHLYLATQRPSTDVLTDAMLENIPGRIVFAAASAADSERLLGEIGAETINERGHLVFVDSVTGLKKNIKAPYVSDDEVLKIVESMQGEKLI